MKQKIKTKRAAAKRFKLTKNGKVKRNKAFANHILTKKSSERKRKYRKGGIAHEADAKNIKIMIPYA